MEVCARFELIALENPATVCNGSLEISKGREAQMIRHMRHGSSPELMAPQPILGSNRRESLATPSAGDRMGEQTPMIGDRKNPPAPSVDPALIEAFRGA